MNYVKRIVCLANSRKLSGRCIAGKEIVKQGVGSWIRPISARPAAEVSEDERRYENGADPRVLDLIDVPFLAPAPVLYQSENHIIDARRYWTKAGDLPPNELANLVDRPNTLWDNGDSSYNGVNDRVGIQAASLLTTSLLLISPESVTIHVVTEGGEFGNPRRRVRADFEYNGDRYLLSVTDPVFERQYLAKPNGNYEIGDCYLCVSLGESYQNHCYKLVAAIILSGND